MDNKIKQMQDILGCSELPKNRVKVEKKEKGLLEKTSESTIILTEDNKMMLND